MIITLDFETYYDKDYTLKKMSTSEYVRDKQFEAISCSIKKGKNKPFCYFGEEEIAKALDKLDWNKITVLAHHTHFDGLILTHHFKKTPARWACTLSMGRALHPKSQRNDLDSIAKYYGKSNKLTMPDFKGKHLEDLTKEERKAITLYNNADVQATYEVYEEMVKDFPLDELDLIHATVKMFAEPVLLVDIKRAKAELKREVDHKEKAIKDAGVDITVLSSSPKFAKELKARGVEPPMKMSPSDPDKMIPALAKSDEEFQALRAYPDPKVVALVEGRIAAKSTIGESKANRLILRGLNGMSLPVYYNYALAGTLRWTGGDKINLQNLKQKQKVGGGLRECIQAPANHVMVVADSAQIEARVSAWLSGEEWVLEAFRQNRDLYCEFASIAYGRTITKADIPERFVGKTCELGLWFNTGGPKLQTTVLTKSIEQGLDPIRLPLEVSYSLVNVWREAHPRAGALWEYLNNTGIGAMMSGVETNYKCLTFRKGEIVLPNGLSLLYPGLNANVIKGGEMLADSGDRVHDASYLGPKGKTKLYGGKLCENVVQALARIIVGKALLRIAAKYRVVMVTHDEIVFLAKRTEGEKALKFAIDTMCIPPEWAPDIPLKAEGGFDKRYSK